MRGAARRFVSAVGALALVAGTLVSASLITAAPAQAAETNAVTVTLHAARSEEHATPPVTKGAAVTGGFRYMINVDNSGKSDPAGGPQAGSGCSAEDPGYPGSCSWASILEDPGAAPIYRQGTDADFGGAGLTLPDGDYLITVLADGYKIDGAHFTVPMTQPTTGGPAVVDVGVQPDPLPDSTLRAQVFIDDASTNGAIDNGETDRAELVDTRFQGHINDTLGEVTTDVYGNPLCTTYVGEDPDTHMIPWSSTSRDADGLPVVDTVGGKCFSDASGMIAIPHVGTNRYTTTVTPPDGSGYLQTTTLEGNHDWDTWLMEGATGYDTEFTVAGEPVPTPQFGFVRPRNSMAAGGGTVKGVVVAAKQYYPPTATGLPAGAAAAFSPATLGAGTWSSRLTVTTTTSLAPGTYPFTVTAAQSGADGPVHSVSGALTVTPAPDFTLVASPTSRSVKRTEVASYALTLGASDGFSGSVTLSRSFLPAGATSSWTSNPVLVPGTTTLKVRPGTTTRRGTYTVTVTGTGGGRTHSVVLTLVVR